MSDAEKDGGQSALDLQPRRAGWVCKNECIPGGVHFFVLIAKIKRTGIIPLG
jgi:hypothetical protein